jgi:AAA domain-containing protein
MKTLTWLPTTSPPSNLQPDKLKYLMIAPPKWGKSTLFAGCPGSVLLAFEAGYEQLRCPKIVMTKWDRSFKLRKLGPEQDERGIVYVSAMEAIEELEANNHYSLVIIDTVDEAVKLCSKYHCDIGKISHPSEGGDYGKGWQIYQTDPFRRFYNRIVKLGCGVAVITHSKERETEDRFKKKTIKKETSLPAGIQEFLYAQSDVIMYGQFGRKRLGNRKRDRYITFDSSSDTMTGTRITEVYLPDKYIVDPPAREDLTKPWKQWVSFFEDDPDAGQQAEKEFGRLIKGQEDESLTEEEEEKENTNNQKYEKVNSQAIIHPKRFGLKAGKVNG